MENIYRENTAGLPFTLGTNEKHGKLMQGRLVATLMARGVAGFPVEYLAM